MKIKNFVELPVDTYHSDGRNWAEWNTFNMSEVERISPDKNWCRIYLKSGSNLLLSESYDEIMERINGD